MNKQDKGDGKRGIGWTDFTWNPVAGCKHACRWTMPDGTTARCYAEAVAEGVARAAYPWGFDHHYWLPGRLQEPLKLKEPARIFLDSMADMMGRWVPDDQVRAVFDICRKAHWHDFQLLTKNAPRLLKFADEIPANVWVGVSAPPSEMWGNKMGEAQRTRWMNRALEVLQELHINDRRLRVLWMSLEPLSFDVAPFLWDFDATYLDWLVIGAASNGATIYQPDKSHVQNVISWATTHSVPLFFKGNLDWQPRLTEMPRRYEAAPELVQPNLFDAPQNVTGDQIANAREAVAQHFDQFPNTKAIVPVSIVGRTSLSYTQALDALRELVKQGQLIEHGAHFYKLDSPPKQALSERICAELTPTGPVHRDAVFARLGCDRAAFDLALRALVSLGKVEDDGHNGLILVDPDKDQQQPITEKLTNTILSVLRDQGPIEYPQLRDLVRVRSGVLYETAFFGTILTRMVKQGKIVKVKTWTYKLRLKAYPSFDEVEVRAMIRQRLYERAGLVA